ncbi:hypothetical protein WBK31_04990 [Nonomuraea sp. N2-4H]|uniref:hypothetical protein n=1 Tax=Nonomuraea sp. N2-4H TaxID=3128898 RepID=UPI003245EF72
MWLSTTIAIDLASDSGWLDQRSGGLPWSPLQEYSRGSGLPSRSSGLVTLISAMSFAWDLPMKPRLPQPAEANATPIAVTMAATRRTRDAVVHSPMPDDATRLAAVRRPFLDGPCSVKDPKTAVLTASG